MENEEVINVNIAILSRINDRFKEVKLTPDVELIKCVYENVCKDKRMFWIDSHKVSRQYKSSGDEPMTDRQRNVLEKSGKEFDPAATKADASKLIKQIYEEKGWVQKNE